MQSRTRLPLSVCGLTPANSHHAFEMGVQTLPSTSLPAQSRIGRAGCPIFATVSSSLRWGPNAAPPLPPLQILQHPFPQHLVGARLIPLPILLQPRNHIRIQPQAHRLLHQSPPVLTTHNLQLTTAFPVKTLSTPKIPQLTQSKPLSS